MVGKILAWQQINISKEFYPHLHPLSHQMFTAQSMGSPIGIKFQLYILNHIPTSKKRRIGGILLNMLTKKEETCSSQSLSHYDWSTRHCHFYRGHKARHLKYFQGFKCGPCIAFAILILRSMINSINFDLHVLEK